MSDCKINFTLQKKLPMDKTPAKLFINYGTPIIIFFFLSLFYFVPGCAGGKENQPA